MTTFRFPYILAYSLLLAGSCFERTTANWRRAGGSTTSRGINIVNKSGVKFDIFWVNSVTGDLAHSNTEGNGIEFGGDSSINSFIGHTFEIQEMKDRNGKCQKQECQTTRFRVSSKEDQVFTVWKNFTVTVEDHQTRALDKAKETVQQCLDDPTAMSLDPTTSAEEQIAALSRCVEERVNQTLRETEEEISFQENVRLSMGQHLTKYICHDEENATLTTSLNNLTWNYQNPATQATEEYNIRSLFDTSDSSALLIEKFLSPDQCKALELHAQDSTNDGRASLNTVTTRSIPNSAKSDLNVVGLLLKTQSYVKSALSHTLKFHVQEPLLTQHIRQAQNEPEERSPSPLDEKECSAGDAMVDGGMSNNQQELESNWVPSTSAGTLFYFCSSTGGAVHFPRTGVHLPASDVVGSVLVISHNQIYALEGRTELADIYMGEYVFCQPQKKESILNLFVASFEP